MSSSPLRPKDLRRGVVSLALALTGSALLPLDARLGAQEPTEATPGFFWPAPDEVERQDDEDMEFLVGMDHVVKDSDEFLWFEDSEGERFRIHSSDGSDLVVDTRLGLCFVDSWILDDVGEPGLSELIQIIEDRNEALGIEIEPVDEDRGVRAHLWWQPLVGHALVTDFGLVEVASERFWAASSDDLVLDDRQEERRDLFRAARKLVSAIDGDDTLHTVLGNVLADIVDEDDQPSFLGLSLGIPSDESPRLPRPVVRRLLRSGWLDSILGVDEARTEAGNRLLEKLARTEAFQPRRSWISSGDGPRRQLVQREDAFGRTLWTETGEQGNGLAIGHREPELVFRGTSLPNAFLEYRFDDSIDPLSPDAPRQARSAELRLWGRGFAKFDGERVTEIGGPDAESDDESDGSSWSDQFSITDWGAGAFALEGALPLHLALTNASGDLLGLALPNGVLWMPRDGDEGPEFLRRASEMLRTAHQIDLLGQYAFQYTSDSPDNQRPELIGTVTACGDRQSTALETIERVRGGQLRGDCDDYSALCAAILELRGVPVIQFGTPGHVSAVWVEPSDEGQQTAYLAQTGPTLQFTARTREDALAKAYRHLDPSRAFDPSSAKAVHQIDNLARPDDVLMPVTAFFDQGLQDLFVARDLLHRRGRYGTIARLLDERLEETPGDPFVRLYRADLAITLGDYATALANASPSSRFDHPGARSRAQVIEVLAGLQLGNTELVSRTERRLLGDSLVRLADVENPLSRLTPLTQIAGGVIHPSDLDGFIRILDGSVLASIDSSIAELRRRAIDGEYGQGRFPGLDTDALTLDLFWQMADVQLVAIAADRGDTDPLFAEVERRFVECLAEFGVPQSARHYVEPSIVGLFAAARAAIGDSLPESLRAEGSKLRNLATYPFAVDGAPQAALEALADDWREPIQRWIAGSPVYWAMQMRRTLQAPNLDLVQLRRLHERFEFTVSRSDSYEAFEGPAMLLSMPAAIAAAIVLGEEESLRERVERVHEFAETVAPHHPAWGVSLSARHAGDADFERALEVVVEVCGADYVWAPIWHSLPRMSAERAERAIQIAERLAGDDPIEVRAFREARERCRGREILRRLR